MGGVAYGDAGPCHGRLITAAGLLRAADRHPDRHRRGTDQRGLAALVEVLAAARRAMDVHVAIGVPQVARAALPDVLHLDGFRHGELSRNVLAVLDADAGEWVARLGSARDVPEAIVVLPAPANGPGFRALGREDWTTCLLAGTPRAVAYRGERRHAFFLVFRAMGVVVRTVRG